jgi:chemotaxis protein histidine kinase CheA
VNRERIQQLFFDVDTPVAEQLVEAMEQLGRAWQPEQGDEASLLCHRLRGDARTVGFELVADLIGAIEDRLRSSLKAGSGLDAESLVMMLQTAREIVRRMKAGEEICLEPLAADWLVWANAQRGE